MTSLADRTTIYASRDEWLADRRNWMGGSEVAAILGLSCYKDATPFRAWQSKVEPEKVAPLEGEFLEWGHRAERMILDRFQDAHPEVLVWANDNLPQGSVATTAHAEFPLIRSTPDATLLAPAFTLDDEVDLGKPVAGVDAKNLSWRRLARDPEFRKPNECGTPGTDEIPIDYVVQGLVYCEVFDVDRWHFACLFGGQTYHEYVVERSRETATSLMVRALDWWQTYVVTKTVPPLDGSESAAKLLASQFPKNVRPLREPTPQARELAAMSYRARKLIADAERDQATADNALKALIADADGIEGIATWKQAKGSTKTDWEAVARASCAKAPAKLQKLIEKHTATTPGSRRFLLKYEES